MSDLIGQLEFIRDYECKTGAERQAVNKAIKIIALVENFKKDLLDYEKTCKVWSANQLDEDVKRCTSCINGTFGRIDEIFNRHCGGDTE